MSTLFSPTVKIAILLVFLMSMSTAAHAKLYRWVDDKGNVHYTDKLPPKAVKHGHVKLSKNGLEKERVGSEKEKRRRAAEIKAERKRQAALKEKKRLADLQEMRDTQLLSMFSSEEDLVKVYEDKLSIATESIDLLKKRHKRLAARLEELEMKQEKLKNINDRNRMGMQIDDILDNLNIYQQAITENMIERRKVRERFDNDLKRFQEISPAEKDAKENS